MADVDDDVLNLDDEDERAPASDRKVSKKDNAKNKKNSIEDALDDPVAGDQLISIVERIERLEEEKKTLNDDIKEVYSEAKANGYDTKILRKVIAIRKRDVNERKEEEAILELYLQALGVD